MPVVGRCFPDHPCAAQVGGWQRAATLLVLQTLSWEPCTLLQQVCSASCEAVSDGTSAMKSYLRTCFDKVLFVQLPSCSNEDTSESVNTSLRRRGINLLAEHYSMTINFLIQESVGRCCPFTRDVTLCPCAHLQIDLSFKLIEVDTRATTRRRLL